MSTKVEPTLVEDVLIKTEPVVTKDESVKVNDPSIEQFLNIQKKQAELNNQIIIALASSDIGKEEKMQMVQMLSTGAQNSSFFMKTIKNKEREIELKINESIPAKSNLIKDKFNKIKNMVISFKANVDPTITFRNPSKPDWYETSYQLGVSISSTSKRVHSTISSFLSQASKGFSVATKEFKKTKESLISNFYLIGEKREVNKLKKKFSKVFDLLGLDAKDVLHSTEMKETVSEDELLKRISAKLNKDLAATQDPTDGKFSFSILNGLTPELQFDMVKTIIWPKLSNAIKESMDMNYQIQQSKDNNRYLQMVAEFAKENNFNPDLVLHSLKNNPELLSGYPKFEILLENKDKIIENANKYGKFVMHNFIYMESLVKASEDMYSEIKKINIPQELKEQFSNIMSKTSILSYDGNEITYEQLKSNIITIKPEEKEYSPQYKGI